MSGRFLQHFAGRCDRLRSEEKDPFPGDLHKRAHLAFVWVNQPGWDAKTHDHPID